MAELDPHAPMTGPEVLAEMRRQLAWVGPSGRMQGHVVIERHRAESLLAWLATALSPVREQGE
jgi:hypothetical protein